MKYYSYVFVRRDLPVSQQIIQGVHAAHDAAMASASWYDGDTPHLVLFEVADEIELINAYREVRGRVPMHIFHEPDYDRGLTAMSSVPIREDDPARLVFADYKLYGAGESSTP